jgi:sortase A
VARIDSQNNLSFDDLRYLMLEKRRMERRQRLGYFRRSGSVIMAGQVPLVRSSGRSGALQDVIGHGSIQVLPKSGRRQWLDRFLLVVEFFAVVGLLVIAYFLVSNLKDLNKEWASSMMQPTLTPTPLIMAVVLPSGHLPPGSTEGIQPNNAEIPEHLRPLVQSMANLPVPTSSPQQTLRIQIPAIGVDRPVVQGDGWEQLKKGVGQHIGSPNPGQNGNIVLSAHNDVFGEIFRDLDKLKPGDVVILFTSQRTYTYIIIQTQVVGPTQVDVMASTQESVVTLISCYPYMVDNQRIVVTARLQE